MDHLSQIEAAEPAACDPSYAEEAVQGVEEAIVEVYTLLISPMCSAL